MNLLERQGNEIDNMLRNVAEKMLLSLPVDIGMVDQQRQFELSNNTQRITGKFGVLGFQVWEHDSKRRLLASQPVAANALVANFVDGFANVQIVNAPWRVYALSDSQRQIQVQVGLPRSAIKEELLRWLGPTFIAALLLLAGIGLAIWIVIHWSLRPVIKIIESLTLRAPLDLTPLHEGNLPQEFSPLVCSFNQLLARLELALQRERDFLGEAAHELRTPLAALLAQAQVLQHARDAEESHKALEHLIKGIERTSRLAQQLLDTARVDSSRAEIQMEDVDLGMVVAMVTDEFSLLAERCGQNVEVVGVSALVKGDIDDLGILVRNLLDNALRHGGEGICVKLQTGITPDGRAFLLIADNGPGIPVIERERVFERFYRAENGHRAHGIGIGLSLIDRIVANHGGELRCGIGLDERGFGIEILFPKPCQFRTI
jgi:two-component system, OmpR family, sensor histidine kinase QseC